jgi:rhamnosyltransferase
MKNRPLVSIIVRTKNEEKWIDSCLEAISNQTYTNYEIILVDNNSTDRTVTRAQNYPITLVEIEAFIPGKAINDGIRASSGEYLVCISAHCIPVDNKWLEILVNTLEEDQNIAGVYGRQEPMAFTPATDKRDLLLVFGLDRKVQYKDSFFHNANSIFRRSVWDKFPFDEKATNIEDRIWGREIINAKYTIVYEPEASVYHYHGIHQSQNKKRCENVVRIIEELDKQDGKKPKALDPHKLKVVALIPLKGKSIELDGKSLLEVTINQAKDCPYVDHIIVSTDNNETAEFARGLGAEVPFMRDKNLSEDHVDLEHVYKYSVSEIEKQGIYADIIVTLETTFPFRPKGFITKLVDRLLEEGLDSVLAARSEYGICFVNKEGTLTQIGDGFVPRKYKDPVHVGVKGLGCATHPIFLREGKLLGEAVGIIETEDPMAFIEIRDNANNRLTTLFSLR